MRKKVLILLLALVFVCSGVFASSFQIGAAGRLKGDFTEFETYKNFENYELGIDSRVNFNVFSVVGKVLFDKTGENNVIEPNLSFNLRADLALVEFAAGINYNLPLTASDEGIIVNGAPSSDIMEIMKLGSFDIRVAAGVNIGALAIGADYTLPIDTFVEYFNNGDYSSVDTFKSGKVSISVLCSVF